MNRPLPEQLPVLLRQREQGAREQRIRRAIGRQHEADRLERFADDQRHPMLGRFEEEMAVNGRREAGDDDGCDVLQRKLLFAFRRLARQLPVFATKRALRRVYADDVVGHAEMPVSGVLTTSIPSLISVAMRTLIL